MPAPGPEHFLELLEAVNDEVFLLEPDGTILWVNEAACRGLGYPAEELRGQNVRRFSHSFGTPVQRDREADLAAGRATVFEASHVTSDGRVVPKEIRAARRTIGGAQYQLAIARDISARRRAEDALRESEERFRSLFENTAIGLYRTTPAGQILLVNPTLVRMLGYPSAEDLMARGLDADRFEPAYDRREFLERIEQDGTITGLEAGWRRADGTFVHIRESARAIRSPDGTTLYYEGTVEDISERREAEAALEASEQFFRGLFEHAHDAILVLDPETEVVLDCNEQACALYGLPRDELLGLSTLEFSVDRERGRHEVARTLQAEGFHRFETRQRRADGSEMVLEIHASRVEYQGRPAIMSSNRDLTHRRNLEAQLHHGQKMEAVGRLAGGVAHDFNNLLTVIGGHADLLDELLEGEGDAHRHAVEIQHASRRGATVARQLLTFSRRNVEQRTVVDCNRVIADVTPMLRRLIGEDVELQAEPHPAPTTALADADQLEQVIVNLAVNARDAMPEGGRFTVATRLAQLDASAATARGLPSPGPVVEIECRDTGAGMEPEVLSKVFEPFFTTKPPGKGTGLGLATAYGIVAQHGGVLQVDSVPDEGTTFTITLPHTVASEVPTPRSRLSPAAGGGRETVLLVEDDEGVRQLARTVLERRGYTVLMADHGLAALEVAAGHAGPIHALVTDVVMPVLGGPELAEQLATSRPDVRVLFMSGYADRAREQMGQPGPGRAFLAKPFAPRELIEALRSLLDARSPRA